MSTSTNPNKTTAPAAIPSARSRKFYTGVSLEPEVSSYLDDLSRRMGMNRSWVLNTIVQEYAAFMEKKNLKPLASKEGIIRL